MRNTHILQALGVIWLYFSLMLEGDLALVRVTSKSGSFHTRDWYTPGTAVLSTVQRHVRQVYRDGVYREVYQEGV